jgi:hypothetical protein
VTRRHRCSLAVLLLAVAGSACGNSNGEALDPDEEPSIASDGIRVVLSVDQATYAPGDSLDVGLWLSNVSGEPQILRFNTSQRYDFIILDEAEAEAYRWSADQGFLQALGEEELRADAPEMRWSERLPAPEAPGRYRLRALITAQGGGLEAELPFEVRGEG